MPTMATPPRLEDDDVEGIACQNKTTFSEDEEPSILLDDEDPALAAATQSTNSGAGDKVKSTGSIRKSALPPKAQKEFAFCARSSNQSEIDMSDVLAAVTQKKQTESQNKKLKVMLVIAITAVIILCAGAFAASFAAVQISKESRIEGGGVMVDINSASGDKTIVQVAPATESKLSLIHALVLDEAHLRTMDEIAYQYYPSGDAGVTRSSTTKVIEVERDVGEESWDVNVTIYLERNAKVVIAPQEPFPIMLFSGGESYALCGKLRCSNFKVDDPDLNVESLDRQVKEKFDRLKPGGRRTLLFTAIACWELARMASTNYGCCSCKLGFVLKLQSDDGKCQNNPNLHNYKGPSRACFGHDVCLSECVAGKCAGKSYTASGNGDTGRRRFWTRRRRDNKFTWPQNDNCPAKDYANSKDDCNCKVKCDEALVADLNAGKNGCDWHDYECNIRKAYITQAMSGLPNKCK